MKKLLLSMCAAVASAALVAPSAQAAPTVDRSQWKPVFTTIAPRDVNRATLEFQTATNLTIPFWRSTVKSPLTGLSYPFEMVGTDPTKPAVSTTIKYVPIALRLHFSDGSVLDPQKPGCNDKVAVSTRFFSSPLFNSVPLVSNGVNVGPAQLVDGFQRANFWKFVHGSNYHVNLAAAAPLRVIDVNAPAGSFTVTGVCAGSSHNIGEIDITAYDALVRQIINKYATPAQLPIIETYNVFETSGGCCILGYHSAYGRTIGTQTYSVGAYNDARIFSVPIEDIHAWTHEIGEWMDDPFVTSDGYNFTPKWSGGQVTSGCQANLEVGDPLTGTAFPVTYGGFQYHPQELVFFSWFYRVASTATGGRFSFNGTFKTAAAKCV